MAEAGRPNYITPAGYKRLVDELVQLRTVARPKIVQEVSDAAAQGDRSENAEYIYGKRIDAAVVVDPTEKRGESGRVFFGATVVLEDDDGNEQELQLVGEDEIDAARKKISWRSPIGAALLGKRDGDDVRVTTPAGARSFTIVEIRYG